MDRTVEPSFEKKKNSQESPPTVVAGQNEAPAKQRV